MSETSNKPSFAFFSFGKLLQELQKLFFEVSDRLHHLHLQKHVKEPPKSAVDIWSRLGQFIETYPVEEQSNTHFEERFQQLKADHSPASSKKTAHSLDNYLDGRPRETGQLGDFYQRKRVRVEVKPHLSEKMSKNTMNHINSALHFAKKGDVQGARLHIELAESARHLASQFMSKQEFAEFEKKVALRIDDILENG